MFTWAQVAVLRMWEKETMWCAQELFLCRSLTTVVAVMFSVLELLVPAALADT